MEVIWNKKISSEKSKLYFLHIPKTAGTSISSMLGDLAHKKGMQFQGPYLLDHLQKSSDWKVANFLAGHLALLPLKHDFKYFTVIRDPIERLYSYYKHVGRDEGHYFNKLLISQNLNFEQWLIHPETRNLNYNLQTRYVTKFPRSNFLAKKVMAKRAGLSKESLRIKHFIE